MNDRYDGMENKEFLVNYFRDHGITEEEIELYSSWGGFVDLGTGIKNDEHGLSYAQGRVDSIKEYRNMTLEDLRKDYNDAPWAWPTAMRFYTIDSDSPSYIRSSIYSRSGIYVCIFEKEWYFFNVGKEEPQGDLLEKMLREGEWLVYTYSD